MPAIETSVAGIFVTYSKMRRSLQETSQNINEKGMYIKWKTKQTNARMTLISVANVNIVIIMYVPFHAIIARTTRLDAVPS